MSSREHEASAESSFLRAMKRSMAKAKNPNATTQQAMLDAEEGRMIRYATVEDLFKKLTSSP